MKGRNMVNNAAVRRSSGLMLSLLGTTFLAPAAVLAQGAAPASAPAAAPAAAPAPEAPAPAPLA